MALIFSCVVGLFVVPPLTESIAGAIFPSKVQKAGFLGLSRKRVENPAADTLQAVLVAGFWLIALGATGALLWLDIPRVAARGKHQPGHLESAPRMGAIPVSEFQAADLATQATCALEAPSAPTVAGGVSSADPVSVDGVGIGATQVINPAGSVGAAAVINPSGTGSDKTAAINPAAVSSSATRPAADGEEEEDDVRPPSSRYTVGERLGRGGMGVVYRGTDVVLGREVALKQLPKALSGRQDLEARFRREAMALAQLNHVNVVQVFDLIDDDQGLWMVMELLPGGDLAARLKASSLTLSESVTFGLQMAAGLGAAHSAGIVHRDFKPANVLLTADDELKVTDFGIAKLNGGEENAQLTAVGTVIGTPTYMSPEQAAGSQVGPTSDVYSLGATLYEMLAGEPMFRGTPTQVLAKQITTVPDALEMRAPHVPRELATLVMQMLEKPPAKRPQTMSEVEERLGAVPLSAR